MATSVQCAPLRPPAGNGALVEDPTFKEILARSQILTRKVLLDIPDTHKSCIHIETLQLNSDDGKFVIVARNIGIPPAPVLRPLSENFTVETSLRIISEGLQLHRTLLTNVLPHLNNQQRLTGLLSDTRDLLLQIHKMLRMVQPETTALPTAPTLTLRLPGEYEEQVAAHLGLVQLRGFCQDLARSLQQLTGAGEELNDG